MINSGSSIDSIQDQNNNNHNKNKIYFKSQSNFSNISSSNEFIPSNDSNLLLNNSNNQSNIVIINVGDESSIDFQDVNQKQQQQKQQNQVGDVIQQNGLNKNHIDNNKINDNYGVVSLQKNKQDKIKEQNNNNINNNNSNKICELRFYQVVEMNDVYILEGDFLYYPKAFLNYNNQDINQLEPLSIMNVYRPVRKVNVSRIDQFIEIELDTTIDKVGNISIVQQSLKRINDASAHQLSIYLSYYEQLILQQQNIINNINNYYQNQNNIIQTILYQNFQQSLKLAQKIITQLNETNSIIMYFIKKLNDKTFFRQTHCIGATKHFLDVCFGESSDTKSLLIDKVLREGLPNFLDYSGYVNFVLQSFSGQQSDQTIDLITADQFKVPCKIQSFMIPLNSIEIIPGCIVYDELIYTIYTPSNQKIIDNIQNVRKNNFYDKSNFDYLDINDFTYEAQSQSFIEKYYPDIYYQEQFKRKKPLNFKKNNLN